MVDRATLPVGEQKLRFAVMKRLSRRTQLLGNFLASSALINLVERKSYWRIYYS
uniref:Transposase n=1 Tax=Ascaris lumbricoides TaxID=6252 RepID=A0A0M3ITY7_ASCLU